MDRDVLLNHLKQGDCEAFQQFYDQYGLPAYRYIYEKTGDTERTRTIWKNTFRTLVARLRGCEDPDLPLLWLTALADAQLAGGTSATTLPKDTDSMSDTSADIPPRDSIHSDRTASPEAPAAICSPEISTADFPRRTGLAVLLIFLIILAAVAVWIGAGFLMTQNVLPSYDLGYSWFNNHIFHLFSLCP